jgi:hypothetical protein
MLNEMTAAGTGVLKPAPPHEAAGGGGGGGWAWLVTARDAMEAEIIRGMLETLGVPVALDWRDPSPFAWMHLSGNLFRPVPVYVPMSMIDQARLQLLETGLSVTEAGTGDEAVVTTPVGFRERRPLMWAMVAALTVIATAWILFVEIFGFAPCVLRLFCIT